MNKTQCPHCFTVYVISDEQLRVSQGMVRCGTCKERFQAKLVEQKKIEAFDPRNAFIEPISEQDDETIAEVAKLIKGASQTDFKLKDFDDNLNSELSIEIEDRSSPEKVQRQEEDPIDPAVNVTREETPTENKLAKSWEFSIDPDVPDDVDRATAETPTYKSADRFDERTQRDKEEHLNTVSDRAAKASSMANTLANIRAKAAELSVSIEHDIGSHGPDTNRDGISDDINDRDGNDGNLIDEVNQLIEQKIIKTPEDSNVNSLAGDEGSSPVEPREPLKQSAINTDAGNTATRVNNPAVESPFSLKNDAKTPLRTWFYSFVLLTFAAVFASGLIYQLWLKQAIAWPDDKRLRTKIAPIIAPLEQPIEKALERMDITIPERRNLRQLELVSARAEPHPTRSSTILLRVSLINGASISQPLPWVELTLHDSDGRLVSRRSLSPDDYSHNNRIKEKIGSRELRKVTIELLKFPEQVTGYELKLLNK